MKVEIENLKTGLKMELHGDNESAKAVPIGQGQEYIDEDTATKSSKEFSQRYNLTKPDSYYLRKMR